MSSRTNTRKSTNQVQRSKEANSTTMPPKEEVGRWESEGGAPQGGRNPTAIKEGQGTPAGNSRSDRKRTNR